MVEDWDSEMSQKTRTISGIFNNDHRLLMGDPFSNLLWPDPIEFFFDKYIGCGLN
jgi:hypothetical protein